jgi:hypothetical protein
MTASRLLIQPIWETSLDAVVVTTFEDDPARRTILYANSAFAALTGIAFREAVGQPATTGFGAQTSLTLLAEAEVRLQDGKAYACTMIKYRSDGTTYCCRHSVAPLLDGDGKAGHLIEIARQVPMQYPAISAEDHVRHFGLTLPMPLLEFYEGEPPKHLTRRPETDALKSLWERKRGIRELPARADFDLLTVRFWAPHLSVAAVLPDDRYQFKLFGSELAEVYGRDLTGSLLDELTPADVWNVVIQHYRQVAQSKRPLFCPISVSNGRWYTEVSRLLLPLSNDGETVSSILGADYSRTTR